MSSDPSDILEGQEKPTVEQVAWVLRHVRDHLYDGGTFRYLIYNRLGYGPEAYRPCYLAGGMDISNVSPVESEQDTDDQL